MAVDGHLKIRLFKNLMPNHDDLNLNCKLHVLLHKGTVAFKYFLSYMNEIFEIIEFGNNLFNSIFSVLSPNFIVFGSTCPWLDIGTRGKGSWTKNPGQLRPD